MKKISLLSVFILLFKFSFAQFEIEWQNTIGGLGWDDLLSITKTNDGGYICGGASTSNIGGDKTEMSHGGDDFWIVKVDSSGNIQWQKTIGGSGDDRLRTIDKTTDGGYICGGISNSNISGDKTENCWGGQDYWVVKLDSLGNILWQNTIGGNGDDYFTSLVQTLDGGYICGGHSNSNTSGDKLENSIGGSDYWVVKLNTSGFVQWQNTFGGSLADLFNEIQQTPDSGYICAGSSKSNMSGDKTENCIGGGNDYWIVKLSKTGGILWQNTIGGTDYDAYPYIIQPANGGFLCAGQSSSGISGDKTENSKGFSDYWLVRLDNFGNILWQRTIGGTDSDAPGAITKTADGGYILAGTSYSGISGDKTEDCMGTQDWWVLKIDSGGNVEWENTIGGNYYDVLYQILQDDDGDYICAGYSMSVTSGDKTESCIGNTDYWIAKLTDKYNAVTGELFIDANANAILDSNEISLQGIPVTELNTGKFAFSNQNGLYKLTVTDTGNFNVSAALNYYTANPLTHSINFNSIKQTDSLNDFAFQPIPGINDLNITITPYTAFRPGFDGSYMLNYKNPGTTSITASVVFYLTDTNYTYLSASIAPSLITADSLVWNNITLTPWQEGNIKVTVHVNSTAVVNSILTTSCIINPLTGDSTPADNYATCTAKVTASFDPNVKLVSDTVLTITQLSASPYLDYIICFQNTGNDTAINVRVLDNISDKLDIATLQLVASSHPVSITYQAHSRLMTFSFENILLPDSGVNEIESHGFVRFRIKPLTTIPAGSFVRNNSFIYFDANTPVQTNWAVTNIVLPNAMESPEVNEHSLEIYPNPVNNLLNIVYPLNSNATAVIDVFDITGRMILEKKSILDNTTVNVSAFHEGVYVIRVSNGVNTYRAMFIKR